MVIPPPFAITSIEPAPAVLEMAAGAAVLANLGGGVISASGVDAGAQIAVIVAAEAAPILGLLAAGVTFIAGLLVVVGGVTARQSAG